VSILTIKLLFILNTYKLSLHRLDGGFLVLTV